MRRLLPLLALLLLAPLAHAQPHDPEDIRGLLDGIERRLSAPRAR